ncbi:MAG: PstS family phosphate ABC transporter substrate-binding protein [Phycisphaerales bacterium]|nr:MAG: PstS family phosphate ABC transporter substrate-binding protein [Phycisphaerales bacterium]
MLPKSFMRSVIVVLVTGLGVSAASAQRLSGRVKVDGSSTVAPIMMAAAEMYGEQEPRVQVTVGISGTGGGFKKFLEQRADLRTDISDASRPIKASERELAAKFGIEYIEIPIAYDGIAVVIHPDNNWCKDLTVEELRRIWSPNSQIRNWSQIRSGFPDVPLKLYGPGPDSGTFDYFVEAIVEKEKACRNDYTASEDDNVLVQGVTGDKGGLGYFGFSYYVANKSRLGLVAITGEGGKPVKPSVETIRNGTYSPLSRPMFIYVNKEASYRPEVKGFVNFLIDNAVKIVEHPTVSYVGLSSELYAAGRERFAKGITGSVFATPDAAGKSLEQVYLGR